MEKFNLGRDDGQNDGQPDDQPLSFPQRHWLLLCIAIAIMSPLAVHFIQAAARQAKDEPFSHRARPHGGTGGTSPSGGAVAPGDTPKPGSINPVQPVNASRATDTSGK